jgi:hypothetical protein
VKAPRLLLTSPSSVSPGRETQVLVELAAFRFLTQRHLEDVLFAGSTVSGLSRQVIIRRMLTRLKANGLIQETPRLTGSTPGAARLAYFLTAAGYRRARALDAGLPAGRPGIRSTILLGHGLMCADVALAFRQVARAHAGHELVDWECDCRGWRRLRAAGPRVLEAQLIARGRRACLPPRHPDFACDSRGHKLAFVPLIYSQRSSPPARSAQAWCVVTQV